MQEEVDLYVESAEEDMQGSLEHLTRELKKIRTGKASSNVFDNLLIPYYGAPTELKQMASVTIPDARSIVIKPFDRGQIGAIEKAIFSANMGLTPQNDGEIIRITVPPLTEERRRDLVKKCKEEGENAKVSIRNTRREAISGIKSLVKDGLSEDNAKAYEETIDKMAKVHVSKVDGMLEVKESDIMTV